MNLKEIINTIYLNGALPHIESFAINLPNFLNRNYAESCYNDLKDNIIFEPHIYGELTKIYTAKKEIGKTYKKGFQRDNKYSYKKYNPDDVCEMFECKNFWQIISKIVGEEVFSLRPPSPYKFKNNSYLCLHDDISHPQHAYEVVINFTKNWKREYGGLAIGGFVKKREITKTPEDFPFYLQELTLDKNQEHYCTLPVFNQLTILKLSKELCHGTTTVVTDQEERIVLASIFGTKKMKETTIKWRI